MVWSDRNGNITIGKNLVSAGGAVVVVAVIIIIMYHSIADTLNKF